MEGEYGGVARQHRGHLAFQDTHILMDALPVPFTMNNQHAIERVAFAFGMGRFVQKSVQA